MKESRRALGDRVASFVLLPAVLVAVGVLAYFTFRTTLQLDLLRRQSVFEATYGLATEKADRLDKRIIEQDNVVMAVTDPTDLGRLGERWLSTAQRETPTVRAILVLDAQRNVVAYSSRASGSWTDEDAFRRLLVYRMLGDMELSKPPVEELRHLHREYAGQSYLVSYWQKTANGKSYLVVAWHDVARIVKNTLPLLYSESGGPPSRVNVVDEEGRTVFGPSLRSGEFLVGVRFPTTLYNWRLQVSPTSAEELASRVKNRRLLELAMVLLSAIVIVAGVATILLAAEKERRISALKSEFVANVSHELKTPLALVRMFSEMLQSGRVANDEKRREYLDIIVSESERLSALIENVLDFAKVERGRDAYEFAQGDVGAVVTKAANVLRYRAERDGVEIAVNVAAHLPESRIDERAISLAVINLVDNALKYAGEGKLVRVDVVPAGPNVQVRVSDRGPGIAPEDRERIFERFVRIAAPSRDESPADGSSPRAPVRGSGIGLSLVRHVAESHGGKAWVESGESGRGSTFVLSLPAVPPPPSSRRLKV